MKGATGSTGPPRGAVRPAPGLLAALLDGSGEGIVLCDADGVVTLANAAAVRLMPGVEPGLPAPAPLGAVPSAPDGRTVIHGGRAIRIRAEAVGDGRLAWYLADLDAAPRTEFLLEAGRRLSASLNPRRCARAATELAADFLCDVAVVLLPATVRRRMEWVRAVSGRPGPEEGTLPVAEAAQVPGLTDALAGLRHGTSGQHAPGDTGQHAPGGTGQHAPGGTGQHVPGDTGQDPGGVPEWLLPEGFGPVGHLLVLPLPGNGVPAGAIVLARRPGRSPFDDDDERMARDLATRAGAAISAASLFREQSAINAILTGDLLPPELPEIAGMRLAGRLRASQQAGAIGGDFYDVYLPDTATDTAPDDGIVERPPLVILGDVCGKGARAAVLAGQVRHSLRTLLLLESRTDRLLELLNRSLLASPSPHSYVTMILAALRTAPGDHVLVDLAVAGHPPPLVLRRDGTVEEVAARGSILGVLKQISLWPATLDLAPGEVCLLYSDGITEAFGGPGGREMFGEERLKAALATCAGMPVEALVERLEQLSTEWLGGGLGGGVGGAPGTGLGTGPQDDRALLAVRAGRPG
ncbi:SpoIIE family protein phosphatase [Microbispora hainanensis]|uniref:SpoIIE family protein phosphatase n=1 Tax=Microbispora hainanensis TaxID=568844 RepID=A0A544YQE2_9ACTN|nr:SpoIIE family protein phosphatase [Microbispora hainanensis]TQS19000.1 SpoIIE family protein phosphatase [Microbispora hainanensis]